MPQLFFFGIIFSDSDFHLSLPGFRFVPFDQDNQNLTMPNNYFQFKQFRIEQSEVAMKVTTEGCLFGAWVDEKLSPDSVLDIGTGTGLLALMLAQKFADARIDAVEVDLNAFRQAERNFKASKWSDRLKVYLGKIQNFKAPDKQYDLIVSNPPFFNRSLLSPIAADNTARHDADLPQQELIDSILRLLSPKGVLYILYPPREAEIFQGMAATHGLFLQKKLQLYNTEDRSRIFRTVGVYGSVQQVWQEEELVIRNQDGTYSSPFVQLLKPYYLHL